MSKDTNRLLGHADEADGIEEYDNPLPDWWLGLFWGAIVWAIAYVAWFALTDQSQVSWYEQEVAAADATYPDQAEAVVQFVYSEQAASAGASVYATYCVACHGAELEGGIGANLADDEWIHGGQAGQVIGIIRNGVLDKGMPAWNQVLSPEQVNQVTSYIIEQNSLSTGRSMDDFTAPAAEIAPATPDGAAGGVPADTVEGETGPGA